MSQVGESVPYDPNAEVRIRVGEDERVLNRRTTTLFTFLGQLSIFNHLWIHTGGESDDGDGSDEEEVGTYIFQASPCYSQLKKWACDNQLPMHLNAVEIPQCDLDAYKLWVDLTVAATDMSDLDGAFPEGWE